MVWPAAALFFLLLDVSPPTTAPGLPQSLQSAPAAAPPASQSPPSGTIDNDRIVTAADVRSTQRAAVWRTLGYPERVLSGGMERGLIAFEEHHMRERLRIWMDDLRRRGFQALFGGLGEGTGFGGGTIYTLPATGRRPVQLLARATFSGYQEFDLRWAAPFGKFDVAPEASYQWRPAENFYGLGHESRASDHSNFALRQSWIGIRGDVKPFTRLRFGADYKRTWISDSPGRSTLFPSIERVFPALQGLDTGIRLHAAGVYFDADLQEGEYEWGGNAHGGASYQHGAQGTDLAYFRYETRLEGRMPVTSGQSALVGNVSCELTRGQPGSPSIPFYLQPHIGGSSTLRGFALDRFYGPNLLLLSLEYRYHLHPNFQSLIFFDEGQIYERSTDLRWLNWHRNYGLGLRVRAAGRTVFSIEYGRSSEGSWVHILFGTREPMALGGPIRYGTYRR